MLRAAVKDWGIGSGPTNGVRLSRGRRTDAATSNPTPEEVGQLVAVAGVQLCDIEFLPLALKVSRQAQRTGGAIDVRAPKYGSERVVFLVDSLVNILPEHVSAHGTSGTDRWLFACDGDDPPHQSTVSYWWRKTLAEAELHQIKLHDLRHFYASGLIASGCDVVTVQRSLGHAKATTTLNTYAHLWPTAEDRNRSAAETIMSMSLGTSEAPRAQTREASGA